ncbi:FadR/GntR family transcriptional regulator [Aureimonas phyllosphaerae]|uniref:DNA-binding FadR family transcriptional regulator n=1 Tax=Aureimonas phyllosphaerae TaxID=1166078 RepID=A0A7W6BMJ4_9HYPH|nr:FCD domain-containing protein [Aureimonas phyllosphaerae]MBB3934733.1 DNA-binding FadR family transcriptional regulator [Aureimonas phyllosphaerae]MBB3958052.1 DNA-binding FadR family transcriptional regulator [Aureimonas phyllosphaerae]SFE91021.1 transcriptional regulator, GntR family [Aureimonas phyllosphaerae]
MSLSEFVLENTPELREAIVRRNVRDVVAEKIAMLIASGIFKVGDDLPSERDLAAALQVSRESVRGGVQILAAKGLLAVLHGARTRVRSDDVGPEFHRSREPRLINSYGLDDVHQARLLNELVVVGDAAGRMDEETLRLLNQSLKMQETALEDPVRFLVLDREFHLAIYRRCANPVLAEFVGDLFGYMMQQRHRAVSEPGAIARSHADHTNIVRALEGRDRDATMSAFEVHIQRIYETTLRVMGMSLSRGDETYAA